MKIKIKILENLQAKIRQLTEDFWETPMVEVEAQIKKQDDYLKKLDIEWRKQIKETKSKMQEQKEYVRLNT